MGRSPWTRGLLDRIKDKVNNERLKQTFGAPVSPQPDPLSQPGGPLEPTDQIPSQQQPSLNVQPEDGQPPQPPTSPWDDPQPQTAPYSLEPPEEEEQVEPSFLQRLKDRVSKMPFMQKRMLDASVPLTEAILNYRVKVAGENHLLVLMTYGGVTRLVELYSWRMNGRPSGRKSRSTRGMSPEQRAVERASRMGGRERRLYGWCLLHNEIHSFNPKKIQQMIVTDKTYQPKFTIELS